MTILVGVDGSEGGQAAVEYAARYAAPREVGLKLVYVAREMSYTAVVDPEQKAMGAAYRQGLLATAAAHAREIMAAEDSDRVVTHVLFGSRVDRLLWAATGCDLIVLGDQNRPQVDRLATGSVLAGVAARSRVPVVGVPGGWSPESSASVVIAAVKVAAESGLLLDHALRAAAERDDRLLVLHAREPYVDEALASADAPPVWQVQARRDLEDLVAAHRPGQPHVPVDIDVVTGQPARVIVDASRDADLVMLTRRPLVYPQGYLGGIGRAILRESGCPVAVLPPGTPS